MAAVKVVGGSWPAGKGSYSFGALALPKKSSWGGFDAVSLSEVVTVEKATEEAVKRVGGTLGWAAVGGIALGPLGLLAGLIAGGRSTDVGFIATFKDGRILIGQTDPKTYLAIVAAARS